jgi:hypothetical protein
MLVIQHDVREKGVKSSAGYIVIRFLDIPQHVIGIIVDLMGITTKAKSFRPTSVHIGA